MNPVFPGQNSMVPEPVSSFQSIEGVPVTLISPDPVPARRPPWMSCNSMLPEPGLRFDIALACLLCEDVAGAGVHREAAMEPCSVDGARAGGEFRVIADAVIVDVSGAGVRLKK